MDTKSKTNTAEDSKIPGVFRSEIALWIGIATTIVFVLFGKAWLLDLSNPLRYGFFFIWLFSVMLWLSFGVVRHADGLAALLGEPYGTLILTIAVIGIEVIMISAVMLTGENNPTLARDTMFSVLMIVLNGMLGLTLLSLSGSLGDRALRFGLKYSRPNPASGGTFEPDLGF